MVHEVADGLRQRGIPAYVLHLDTAWFQEDWNCDLRFPRIVLLIPNAIWPNCANKVSASAYGNSKFLPPGDKNPNYSEGRAKGYFAKDQTGEVFAYRPERKGSWMDDAIIDFSNPEAAAWYAAQIWKCSFASARPALRPTSAREFPKRPFTRTLMVGAFTTCTVLVYIVVARAIKRVSGEDIVWAP